MDERKKYMKKNKIPSVRLAELTSYVIIVFAVLVFIFVCLMKWNYYSAVIGFVLFVFMFSFAVLLRLFAVMTQNLFDTHIFLIEHLTFLLSVTTKNEEYARRIEEYLRNMEGLYNIANKTHEDVNEFKMKLIAYMGILQEQSQLIHGNLETMNCDSKDINKNITDIRAFFETIQKHLHLTK